MWVVCDQGVTAWHGIQSFSLNSSCGVWSGSYSLARNNDAKQRVFSCGVCSGSYSLARNPFFSLNSQKRFEHRPPLFKMEIQWFILLTLAVKVKQAYMLLPVARRNCVSCCSSLPTSAFRPDDTRCRRKQCWTRGGYRQCVARCRGVPFLAASTSPAVCSQHWGGG